MIRKIKNIFTLSIKELKSFVFDKSMVIFVAYLFSVAIYITGSSASIELKNVSIAFVDFDKSRLSSSIIDSFYKPRFNKPEIISYYDIDKNMDNGHFTFVIIIPNGFEKDILASKVPEIEVNIDATRMTQAGIGSFYIRNIINNEVSSFLQKNIDKSKTFELISRYKYNQNLEGHWFGSITEIINSIIMVSILLSAASVVREKELGTFEHILVLPVTSFEVMISKIISVTAIVLIGVTFSTLVVVKEILDIPINGSISLYLFSTFLVLFATTSIGIFLGTIARNMPQLGLLFIITIIPLMLLSGTLSPFESMPLPIQYFMKLMPTSHFVEVSQAILFRDANFYIVYKKLIAMFLIGLAFFVSTLFIFRKTW